MTLCNKIFLQLTAGLLIPFMVLPTFAQGDDTSIPKLILKDGINATPEQRAITNLIRMRSYDQAMRTVNAGLTNHPDDAHLRLLRAYLSEIFGQDKQATQDLAAAVASRHLSGEELIASVILSETLENWKGGVEVCDMALAKISPHQSAQLLRMKGRMLTRLKRYDQAEAALLQSTKLSGVVGQVDLIRLYTLTKQYGKLIPVANARIADKRNRLDPQMLGSLYKMRGDAHFALHDYAKALKDFEEFGKLSSFHHEALQSQVKCLEVMGQTAKAKELRKSMTELEDF